MAHLARRPVLPAPARGAGGVGGRADRAACADRRKARKKRPLRERLAPRPAAHSALLAAKRARPAALRLLSCEATALGMLFARWARQTGTLIETPKDSIAL